MNGPALKERWARLGRRGVVALVCVGMVMMSPGVQTSVIAQSQPDRYESALVTIDEFVSHLEALRSLVDRAQFDVDVLALELAFEEPEAIVEWVRTHVAYEPYVGLLRGAEGTLMSRAGNALDQAVLLATLLNDIGFDARVAAGELDPADAQRLLDGRFVAAPAPAMVTDIARFEEVLVELAALGGVSSQRVQDLFLPGESEVLRESDAYLAVVGVAEGLTDRLMASGIELGTEQPTADLLSEARSYHWVQFQGLDGVWRDAHPAFVDGDVAVEAREVYEGTIPEVAQHRVRVELVHERRLADELEEAVVGGVWERPAALVYGEPLTFGNHPIVEESDAFGVTEILALDPVFVPLLDRASMAGVGYFDLSGAVVDPMAAANPASGVFRNVGGAFGEAAGGLSNEEDPSAFVALTAQHLDFTLIAPGGAETRYRRTQFDRIAAEDRAAGRLAVAPLTEAMLEPLLYETTFMFLGGRLSRAASLDRMLERLIVARPAWEAAVRETYRSEEPLSQRDVDFEPNDTVWLGHLVLFEFFDQDLTDAVAYRPEPTLVMYQDGLTYGLPGASVDVVHHRKRLLTDDGVHDPAAALLTGVWETAMEGVVLAGAPEERFDAFRAIEEADAAGVPIKVVRPGNAQDLDALAQPLDVVRHVRADLDRGYVLVIPEAPVDGRTGWWRVDPVTGETLGMLGDGRGGELTERAALISVNLGLASWIGCMFYKNATSGDSAGKKTTDCLKIGLAVTATGITGSLLLVGKGAANIVGFGMAALALIAEVVGNAFPE